MAASDQDLLGRSFARADFGPHLWRVVDVHAEEGNPRPELGRIQNTVTRVVIPIRLDIVRAHLVPE